MNTPTQVEFDWLLATFRPLLRMEEAAVILHDCTPRHVADLVDEGKLRAFDLAPAGDAARNRLLRLDRASVLHAALARNGAFTAQPVERLLPVTRPTLQIMEIARWFGLSEQTVRAWNLPRPTTDSRALVFTKDAIQFLASREVHPSKI